MKPQCAMVLAAGLGTRMRPLTDELPKPLLRLGGRTLLDHTLDRLAAAGVERVVVNAHWRAERLAEHVAARQGKPEVVLQHEPELLDTGGAVRKALASGALRGEAFYIVNGDAFWLDGPKPALAALGRMFVPGQTDFVLLLHPTVHARGEVGLGDFFLDPLGCVRRRGEREIAPYVFTGVQIASPRAFADAPDGAFSMNLLWDHAIAAQRLRGVVHDGLWFHLSTPEDLAVAEACLRAGVIGESR